MHLIYLYYNILFQYFEFIIIFLLINCKAKFINSLESEDIPDISKTFDCAT